MAVLDLAADEPVSFNHVNMKKCGHARERYEAYKVATTLKEAYQLGATRRDILHDFQKKFLVKGRAKEVLDKQRLSDAARVTKRCRVKTKSVLSVSRVCVKQEPTPTCLSPAVTLPDSSALTACPSATAESDSISSQTTFQEYVRALTLESAFQLVERYLGESIAYRFVSSVLLFVHSHAVKGQHVISREQWPSFCAAIWKTSLSHELGVCPSRQGQWAFKKHGSIEDDLNNCFSKALRVTPSAIHKSQLILLRQLDYASPAVLVKDILEDKFPDSD